jgi:hypothetical protein
VRNYAGVNHWVAHPERQGHFQAKLNDLTPEELDANSEKELAQSALVGWSVVPGLHQVTLTANNDAAETSRGDVSFDVDFAIITAGDGDPS